MMEAKLPLKRILAVAAIVAAGVALLLIAISNSRTGTDALVAQELGTKIVNKSAANGDTQKDVPSRDVAESIATDGSVSRPQSAPEASAATELQPLDGTSGEVTVAGKQHKLTGADGLFDRLYIPDKGPIQISLRLANLKPGEDLLITAPNGGKLARRGGGPLDFKASGTIEPLLLDFDPVLGRGVYTIRVQHGGASQVVDLWAGPPNPLGEPGPAYVAQPSTDNDTPTQP
jgi:hypothetical protein